jgi:hypothetical protein
MKKNKENNPNGPGISEIFNEPVRYTYPGFPGNVLFTYGSQRNFDPTYIPSSIDESRLPATANLLANRAWPSSNAKDFPASSMPPKYKSEWLRDAIGIGTANQVYKNALEQVLPSMSNEYPNVVLIDSNEKKILGASPNDLAWYNPDTKEVFHPIASSNPENENEKLHSLVGDLVSKSYDLGAYGYMFHPEAMQDQNVVRPYLNLSDAQKFYIAPNSLAHEIGHRYDDAVSYPLKNEQSPLWSDVMDNIHTAYTMNPKSLQILNFDPENLGNIPNEMFAETFRDSLIQQLVAPENQEQFRVAYETKYGTPYPLRIESMSVPNRQSIPNFQPAQFLDNTYQDIIANPSSQSVARMQQSDLNNQISPEGIGVMLGMLPDPASISNANQYEAIKAAMEDAYSRKANAQSLDSNTKKSVKSKSAKNVQNFIPKLQSIPIAVPQNIEQQPLEWRNLWY